jgi:hypothetical protein
MNGAVTSHACLVVPAGAQHHVAVGSEKPAKLTGTRHVAARWIAGEAVLLPDDTDPDVDSEVCARCRE